MLKHLTAFSVIALVASTGLRAADARTPEEFYKPYATRLADIPPGWAARNALRMEIRFNLRFPPNSPEANAFLRDMVRTITGMPFGIKVRIERPITPETYTYCASILFKDWATNRAYESSAAFRKYLDERWRPAVTESTDYMLVLDEEATAP